MQQVEIRIEGHLSAEWADWFEGFDLICIESGDTLITGCVPDQAALYGLIAKMRDLGAKLKSVKFELASCDERSTSSPSQT